MAKAAQRDPFERGGVDTPRVLLIAAATATFLALSMGGLAAIYSSAAPPHAMTPANLPAPEVRPDQGREIRTLLSRQRRRLEQGPMPIDRAMAAVAARGARAYDPIVPDTREKP